MWAFPFFVLEVDSLRADVIGEESDTAAVVLVDWLLFICRLSGWGGLVDIVQR